MKKISKPFLFIMVMMLSILVTVGIGGRQKVYAKERITFWHEMTGPGKEELEQLVNEYNESQSKYYIVPEYEGEYPEVVQKVINTHGTSASPAIFQSADFSIAQMNESNYTTPIQNFIDKDKGFNINDIYKLPLNYYSHDGKILAMPFNTSQPVLYYNKKIFRKYHVSYLSQNPSYSEITSASKKLYENSNHQVKGLGLYCYGWYFEQFSANAGVPIFNKSNGRKGYSTKANFSSNEMITTMKWLQDGIKNNYFINYGTGNNASTNVIAGFLANKIGIMIESSGSAKQIMADDPKDIGICFYPHMDGQKRNGVAIGGAALWISNDKSTTIQKGCWDFIKFMISAKSQAKWQISTGYLALNRKAENQSDLKEYFEKYPALKIPSRQLATSIPVDTNSGCYTIGMSQERNLTQTAMEQIFNGENIKEALENANQLMNTFFKQSNTANNFK